MVNIEFLNSILGNLSPDLLILFEIGSIIIFATVLAFLIKALKQPIIPGYIIAGVLIGPLVFGLIKNQALISSLSEIGVAFLIFTAGLEIKFKKLKEVGKITAISGVLQVLITFVIAFLVSIELGYNNHSAIYIGLVVAFSSTMIVFKILSDKKEINSLHGRIVIGILLIQDVVAILALLLLGSDFTLTSIAIVLGKAILFAIFALVLSKAINPVLKTSAKSHELLLLVSISFLFLFIIGSFLGGFSLAIGAFFAGVCLANSDYKTEIEGKVIPIREFFAVMFFVTLGMELKLITGELVYLFVVLLLLVVFVKPFVTMFLVRIFGYKKNTSFFIGNALGQTSEFSLILVTLGLSLGQISEALFSTLVLLTVVTMTISTYSIKQEKRLAKLFSWPLNILDRMESKKEELELHFDDGKRVVIFGCHRMGSLFVKEFEASRDELFVVDYNPDIIRSLIDKNVPCIYGDFANEEVFNKIDIKKAEVVISTIPDIEDNILLIKKTRSMNRKAMIFVVASRISEALELYNAGADYVILPQVVGGQKVSEVINKVKFSKEEISKLKKDHVRYLKSIHNILY